MGEINPKGLFKELADELKNVGTWAKIQEKHAIECDDDPAKMILCYLVQKNHDAGNVGNIAMFLALFTKDFGRQNIPSSVKEIAKKNGVEAEFINDMRLAFGYTKTDGTHDWFYV